MSSQLPLPQSKNHLLSAVDSLTYTQRFNYASRLGRDHKGKPALRTLVNDLLKHPDPPVPEMEAEDGFTEILPAQRTTIAKYYNEDQLALAIAVAAGMFDVIKERLTSPSTFFDHLVFTNYVRMKQEGMKVDSGKKGVAAYCATDDELVQAILNAVPARRRLLIQETMQAKRMSAITVVVPKLIALPNYDYKLVGHIIHACSRDVVKEFLSKHLYESVGQVWNKLIKFHALVVLELLEEQLAEVHPLDRQATYDVMWGWAFTGSKTEPRFLRNKQSMEKLLDIVAKYPILRQNNPPKNSGRTTEPGTCDTHFPQIIMANMLKFFKAFPEKTFKLILSTIYLHHSGRMQLNKEVMVLVLARHIGYKYINQYIERAFTTSPAHVLCLKYFNDHDLIKGVNDVITHIDWNTYQILTVTKMIAQYLNKHKPNPADKKFYEWSEIWSSTQTKAQQALNAKYERIYAMGEEEQKKKAALVREKLAKYRKAVFTVYETFFPTYLENIHRSLGENSYNHERRKINVTLDAYSNMLVNIIQDTVVAKSAFEKVKGELVWLAKDNDESNRSSSRSRFFSAIHKFISCYKNSYTRHFLEEEKQASKAALKEIFQFVKDNLDELDVDSEMKSFFDHDRDLTYEIFFPQLQLDPSASTRFLFSIFSRLSAEQQIAVYKWFSLDNLVHMVKNRPEAFVSIVGSLPIALINEAVMHMLTTPSLIDENTRNSLVSFQDINDIKIRNALQKMSNSNNVSERNGALQSLVMATARSKDMNQVNRTLKFIREKIKNETAANRGEILDVVEGHGRELLLPEGVSETQFTFWYDMLTDALESPDLDNDVYDKSRFSSHPVLKFFQALSDKAIEKSTAEYCKKFDPAIFEFGAELLWRLSVFRHGEKKAAQENFKLEFNTSDNSTDESLEKVVASIRQVLPVYIAAYEKRIAEKNPEWKSDYKYFTGFFEAAPKRWQDIPELVAVAQAVIAKVKAEANKDDDGLYIIPSDNQFNELFRLVKAQPTQYWKGAMLDVVDLAMHSRLVAQLIKNWVGWKEEGAKKSSEFKARKDKYIVELLNITPSAIHLRFVWRHLVTYMQNKLDDYIGKRKTFRGVFYCGPDKRKFDRSCIKTPETRRTGGRARSKPSARGRKGTNAGIITGFSGNPQQDVDEERAKEAEIKKELEDVPEEFWDHEDFFYLEACFGLHRLLPRQVNVLVKDWEVQMLSTDRAVPYKVKCTARWTVMPTMSYGDLVTFLNANENPTPRHKGLSVNVIEALLRGVMRNDEPTAPLNFLLSPKFLGSDRSRVSVYAIAQSVPYMPMDGLTNMLKLCLSGKRRQQLKISSYKEIIRLLASSPTDVHLNTIFNEWKRPDLHRDVRIAILVSAMKFLHSKDQRFNSIAWKILEHGATLQDQHEILTALLGTKEENGSVQFSIAGSSGYVSNSRILEHLDDLSKQSIPQGEKAERFGKNVVAVIAQSAKNDDVKFIAVGSLRNWPIPDIAADLIQKYLMNFGTDTLLYSTIPSERKTFEQRWQMLITTFLTLTICETADAKKVIELATALCNRIVGMTGADRVQRAILVGLAKAMLAGIPVHEITSSLFQDGEEQKLLDVFQKTLHNIFSVQIFERKQIQLAYRARNKTEIYIDPYLALLHEVTAFACTYPTVAETFYISMASSIIRDSPDSVNMLLKVFALKVDTKHSPISKTPDYLYLLRRMGLYGLQTDSLKSIVHTHSEETLKFWESVFDFAQERKDLPREHLKGSQIFDFATLARSISQTLEYGVRTPHSESPVYPGGNAHVIGILTRRYLNSLKGESGDAFGAKVGDYLIKETKLIPEAAPVELLFEIVHILMLTTKEVLDIAPRIIVQLNAARKDSVAATLSNDILSRNLNKTKPDWGQFYVSQSRALGLKICAEQDRYPRGNAEVVRKFVEDTIPHLTEFELSSQYANTIQEKVRLLAKAVENACFYDHSFSSPANEVAERVMNTHIPKYLAQPKGIQNPPPAELASRAIVLQILAKKPRWIVVLHPEKIPNITEAVLQDASMNVIGKAEALTMLEAVGSNCVRNNDSYTISELFTQYFSNIINLHKRFNTTKNKKFIEISFDLAFNLLKQFPAFVGQNPEETFYFLNWAISMYIREPDVAAVLQQIKIILTHDYILPREKFLEEKHITGLVGIISTLIDLKHQEFVLPQQTLLPLQSYAAYTHVSHHLALNMVRKFGGSTRQTEEHEYVWRPDFVELLDRLCALNDPQVKMEAWSIETVQPK